MYLSFEDLEHKQKYQTPWKWNWIFYSLFGITVVYKIHRTIDARTKFMAWKRSTAYGQVRLPKKMMMHQAKLANHQARGVGSMDGRL